MTLLNRNVVDSEQAACQLEPFDPQTNMHSNARTPPVHVCKYVRAYLRKDSTSPCCMTFGARVLSSSPEMTRTAARVCGYVRGMHMTYVLVRRRQPESYGLIRAPCCRALARASRGFAMPDHSRALDRGHSLVTKAESLRPSGRARPKQHDVPTYACAWLACPARPIDGFGDATAESKASLAVVELAPKYDMPAAPSGAHQPGVEDSLAALISDYSTITVTAVRSPRWYRLQSASIPGRGHARECVEGRQRCADD